MRILVGLLLALFVLVSLAVAADQGKSPSTDLAPANSDSQNLLGNAADLNDSLPLIARRRDPNHRYVEGQQERTVTCLKMRSYLMARESEDSDATRMVGYRTCTPSARFDVRLSTEPSVTAR
jgi:hypothetical protein